ncbi:ArdC family protein [Anaerostipes sp.]|uniref:ArdC family protein n=1 Tax=Anaerostipes sp. TaxID=1872530 RepID=UPI0025829932|nr:zincin-like metallopeptidase domain-containing protein [Anaerostipes sp.]MCI5622269.1 zincin-like metallopeptidase domain-containing protein [Anaerostipes sp.]
MNVYQIVTERIIKELEKGNIPWKKPWINIRLQSGAYNRISKKPYSLMNQMLLGRAGEYATYKQWTDLGGKLKEGAKSEIVVFWKLQIIKDEKENGEIEEKQIPLLRYYRVFHISQIQGIDSLPKPEIPNIEGIKEGDQLIEKYASREKIRIKETISNDAFYNPRKDIIVVPKKGQFDDINEFYSTVFHEIIHSTGHVNRLNRETMGKASFGSNNYSREELVAETGSAMLMNIVGLETDGTFKNSAAYLQSWIRHLKEDEKLIVAAAGKAEKAVKFVMQD